MSRVEGMRFGALRQMMCLAAVALVIGSAAAPRPAAAQTDPMEEQRCVWRCLAQSRGASDPAYHACVNAQCTRPPARSKGSYAPPPPARPQVAAPPARGQAWKTVSDLPYPAVAQCLPLSGNAKLCLVVSCPARDGLSLELYGMENGLAGVPLRLSTSGALFDLTLPPRAAGDDAYRWPMPIGLAAALKADAEASLEVNGRGFRLPLTGSGAAIGEVEARCR